MSEQLAILVGHAYRAKKPRQAGIVQTYANDREVRWTDGFNVQYDSPSVSNGRHYPTVTIAKFREWAGRDVTDELPNGEWQPWPIPKKPIDFKLTDIQIYVLRRLNTGTKYLMRGDARKAAERRPLPSSTLGFDDVNAPSIPVLVRFGLVDFAEENNFRETSLWYGVKLTEAGKEAANTLKVTIKDKA